MKAPYARVYQSLAFLHQADLQASKLALSGVRRNVATQKTPVRSFHPRPQLSVAPSHSHAFCVSRRSHLQSAVRRLSSAKHIMVSGRHRAFIALGSNEGDRFRNIEAACNEIENDEYMSVLRTSCLYETAPMYVLDQGNFLNGACEVCDRPICGTLARYLSDPT